MNYSLYASNFRASRKECLEKYGHKCARCGVKNHMLVINDKLDWFIVYLHAAHVFENQRLALDAPLIALCPHCHWCFDHPQTFCDWYFIGLVYQQFIESHAREAICQ